jgi:hypothetical protein
MISSGILSHDADWQYPAITEEHAYRRAAESLPEVNGIVYLAFPWATLIDLIWHGKNANNLRESLRRLSDRVMPGTRIATVCQHIRLLDHIDILLEAGITDIFWSHAIRGQQSPPGYADMNVFPFPLYPVQAPGPLPPSSGDRPHLFCFLGAKSEPCYLSPARELIFEILGQDRRGVIRAREDWHYREEVYRDQIGHIQSAHRNPEQQSTKEEEFRDVLSQSVFSLCPSGSGPNTIRLWESLALGAIPVVLSTIWQPPGDPRLWEDGVIFCGENRSEIENLPKNLEKINADKLLLEKKKQACREIWLRYGPRDFIYDIQTLYAAHAQSLPNESPVGNAAKSMKAIPLASDSFFQANRLYREGRYTEAFQIYEALAAREPLGIYSENAKMAKAKLELKKRFQTVQLSAYNSGT